MREEDEGNFNKNGFGRSFDVMSSEDKRVFQNLTDEGFRSVTQMEREIEGVMEINLREREREKENGRRRKEVRLKKKGQFKRSSERKRKRAKRVRRTSWKS